MKQGHFFQKERSGFSFWTWYAYFFYTASVSKGNMLPSLFSPLCLTFNYCLPWKFSLKTLKNGFIIWMLLPFYTSCSVFDSGLISCRPCAAGWDPRRVCWTIRGQVGKDHWWSGRYSPLTADYDNISAVHQQLVLKFQHRQRKVTKATE